MESKKLFGGVRTAALATLVVGGFVLSVGCKSSSDSSGAATTEKSGEQKCGGENKCGGEQKCGKAK
jgi:hypothetical protein